MNRREALISLGLTTLSHVAWSSSSARLLQAALAPASPAAAAVNPVVLERLKHDLALLGTRVNSEEGVPMILACDNLVPDSVSHRPPKPALLPLNAALAGAMHSNAPAFASLRPGSQYGDVAKLIEVLAYRDYTHRGKLEQL